MGLLGQAPSQLITATDGSVGEGLRWNGKKILITIKPRQVAGFFVYKRETHIIHTNTKVTLTQFIGLVCKIFSEIFKIGTGFYGK